MTVVLSESLISLACGKHNLYFVGYLEEPKGKIYAFRCDKCQRPFYIRATKFWKGTP